MRVAVENPARGAYQRRAADHVLGVGKVGVEINCDHSRRMLDLDDSLRRGRQLDQPRSERAGNGAG